MNALIFTKDYFSWHYGAALKKGLIIWRNFLWFVAHFFSIGLLFRTLFSPWKRMHEYYGRGFDLGRYFETLIINVIMRLVGFFARSIFILAGLAVEAGTIILGALVFAIWLGMPLFLILCFSRGITLFFKIFN